MTETITIGGKDYPLSPMNAQEATELMFVLTPYAKSLSLKKDPLNKLGALFEEIKERDPADLFRMLAYMLHVDAEELINKRVAGHEVATALASCLSINSLPDLINIAYTIRIVDTGWEFDV